LDFTFDGRCPSRTLIVDFACYHPRVIVEVDGSQHSKPRHELRDAGRDAVLAADGFRIVRVWNNDVDENLGGVFDQILHELRRE
jgi:very-short-patch-repair endonuclease